MPAPRHAIVLAAGEGSRLRPLTDTVPKPALPIDGRAVIARVLDQLAANGVEAATVVVGYQGEVLRDFLERSAPAEAGWPALSFAVQDDRRGSAHALQVALEQGAPHVDSAVVASDTWWRDEDVAALFDMHARTTPMVTMGLRRWPVEELPHRSVCDVDDALRVRGVLEKPPRETLADGTGLSGSPIYCWRAEFWPYVEAVRSTTPANIRELADALQRAIDEGHVVQGVEVTGTRDITSPRDLLRHNFPYLAPWLRDA